ncbi:MAG: S-layer homology domain-containing protein [Clostridiales bacterium]|nr:S-layer homology domain-containing protein [Clostridiales bacterium]
MAAAMKRILAAALGAALIIGPLGETAQAAQAAQAGEKELRDEMIVSILEELPSYLYDVVDPGEAVEFPYEDLGLISNSSEAASAVKEAAAGLTDSQKRSASGIDRMTLYAEEALAQAASEYALGEINIDLARLEALKAKALEAKAAVEEALAESGIETRREVRLRVKILTDAKMMVLIDPSAKEAGLDGVVVETPSFSLEFSQGVLDLVETPLSIHAPGGVEVPARWNGAASSSGLNMLIGQDLLEGIKLSISISGDPDNLAIMNESRVAFGGKLNPATGRLEAKIFESGTYSAKENSKSFSDISSKSNEMQKAITALAAKGIISGVAPGVFSPDSAITRAEVAAIVTRILSKQSKGYGVQFDDVETGDWYYDAAVSAKENGIMAGTSESEFSPEIVIPKDQLVAVVARALILEMKYKEVDDYSILSMFADEQDFADWSKVDISFAAREGLVVERSDGLFDPSDEMTRGDAAVLLYRLFSKVW